MILVTQKCSIKFFKYNFRLNLAVIQNQVFQMKLFSINDHTPIVAHNYREYNFEYAIKAGFGAGGPCWATCGSLGGAGAPMRAKPRHSRYKR
jgi:hypothetical protein